MVNVYNLFIPVFTCNMQPLYEALSRKSKQLKWLPEMLIVFDNAKRSLAGGDDVKSC